MRALPFVLLAGACGAAARGPAVPPPPNAVATSASAASAGPGASASASEGAQAAAEAASAYAALESRGPLLAPGMQVVARKESGGEKLELVRAEGRDVCVRVAFEATAPMTARLLDGAGNVLAASEAPATDGVLGPRGPVCIRKADVVAASADGGGRVRWIVWEAR